MTWISYAQNFEDVILMRALNHVPEGMYIDIGAQHPLIDSVSRAFYGKGWRGIHVEPTHLYADALRQNRPDEIVVQAMLGKSKENKQFYIMDLTRFSRHIIMSKLKRSESNEQSKIHRRI